MSSSSGGTGISLVSLLQASQVTTGNHHVTGSEQVTGRVTEVQMVPENDVNMAEAHENDAEVGYDRNAVNGGVKKNVRSNLARLLTCHFPIPFNVKNLLVFKIIVTFIRMQLKSFSLIL